MNYRDIILEANTLVERIKQLHPDFEGETANEDDMKKLEEKLNIKLPQWYIELYTTVPLIGAEFGAQEDEPIEDYDGVSHIMWGNVDDIIEENTEYEPGTSALKDNYVFVASCSHGSGDPIFIKINSEIPAVYRIYHDDFTNSILADNLASLFKNAKIT